MVTFKGGWDKLYYPQHTLLSNVGQLELVALYFGMFLVYLIESISISIKSCFELNSVYIYFLNNYTWI